MNVVRDANCFSELNTIDIQHKKRLLFRRPSWRKGVISYIRSLGERIIYLRYAIPLRAMISMKYGERGLYHIFTKRNNNTAQAVYHVSPEIYYNLLTGKSCSLPNVGTHLSIQPLWNFPFLKGSIPVCSVYKKPETISLRNVSVKKGIYNYKFWFNNTYSAGSVPVQKR